MDARKVVACVFCPKYFGYVAIVNSCRKCEHFDSLDDRFPGIADHVLHCKFERKDGED